MDGIFTQPCGIIKLFIQPVRETLIKKKNRILYCNLSPFRKFYRIQRFSDVRKKLRKFYEVNPHVLVYTKKN